MQQTLVGLRQAIEAHFADVERAGIRNGKNVIVVTTIYIDNVKAFRIKSTKSKIGECKVCDKRLKAVLNNHPVGYLFINSKYSYVFGDSATVAFSTLHELCVTAILDFNENRVRFKSETNKWSWMLFMIEIAVSITISLVYLSLWGRHKLDIFIITFCIFVLAPTILSLIYKTVTIRYSTLTSIISFVIALIAGSVWVIVDLL